MAADDGDFECLGVDGVARSLRSEGGCAHHVESRDVEETGGAVDACFSHGFCCDENHGVDGVGYEAACSLNIPVYVAVAKVPRS